MAQYLLEKLKGKIYARHGNKICRRKTEWVNAF